MSDRAAIRKLMKESPAAKTYLQAQAAARGVAAFSDDSLAHAYNLKLGELIDADKAAKAAKKEKK